MNKEQLKEKKKKIESITNYNDLVKDISESFIPIPTIFQFFILDKREMKSFLYDYYKIYLSFKNIFYRMYEIDYKFNSDNKNIFHYIKINKYNEQIVSFKESNIFNLVKLKGIRDLLLDKITLFENNNFKSEIISELKKISNKLYKLERKKTSLIKLSDSSLSENEFNEFNISLNKNNFYHWNAFENLEINLSSEYLNYSSNKKEAEFLLRKAKDVISSKYESFLGYNDSNDSYIKKKIKEIDSKITKTDNKNKIFELKKEKDKLKFELYSEKSFLPDPSKLDKLRNWKKIQNVNIDISNNNNNIYVDDTYNLKNYDLSFTGIDLLYIESESDVNEIINNIFDGFYDKTNYDSINFYSNDEKIEHLFSGINYLSNTVFSKYINMFYYENILDSKILGASYITEYKTNQYFNSLYDLKFFIPIVNEDTISLYYIFFDPDFFAGYDSYNIDLSTNLTKKTTLLNKEIIKMLSNSYLDRKNLLLNENLLPNNKFSLLQKEINNTIKDLHDYISINLNRNGEGIIYSSFIKCYSNENKNFFINENNVFTSEILSKVLNTKTFCYFFNSALYFDSNLNPHEKIYLEILFKSLFKNEEKVSSIDLFLENNLSEEELFDYKNDELSITVFLYPIKLSDLSIVGIYLAIFKRNGPDCIQSDFFSPIKKNLGEILKRIELIINLDVNYNIKSSLIDNIDELDELNLLNKIFIYTRKITYFPSIFFISDLNNVDIYNILSSLLNDNNLILDSSEFEVNNLKLETIFNSFDIKFNKNEVKALKIHLLKNFNNEKYMNQKIIVLFVYKSYNNFFFNSRYSEEIINIIENEILDHFLARKRNIELKNMHEMIFSMLEHKIGTDTLVNNDELESVMKNINSDKKLIENEKFDDIKSSLEFVIYKNKERQKFLKAVKPLLFNDINFNKLSNVNIKNYLNEEIENTIKLKIPSVASFSVLDWKNLKVKAFCYVEDITIFDESKEFIGFIFFELLSNAVKYKNNSVENTVDFDITKINRDEHYFLKISVSNLLKEENKKSLNLKEIFNKGKRFGDSKTTSGTGLGLYIIRYITENTFHGRVNAKIDKDRIVISVELDFEKLG